MSPCTLSFLCVLAIFALQVPGNLGRKYIDIPGIGRIYLPGNTKVQKISNGGRTITKITGSFSGGWSPFKPVNPNNGWNPFKPVNPNNGWNPFKPVNPNNGWNPFKPVNPNNGWNPFKPVNPNNGWNPNKSSGNSGPGSSRGSGGSPSSSSSVNPSEIVNKHNELRRRVSPPASNMLKMSWSKKFAANAQKWADKCTLGHSSQQERQSKNFGENLYMSDGPSSWDMVVKSWYDEVKFWKYGVGATKRKKVVGHFTQVVWAKSNKIGCGMATCPNAKYKYFFVCQYSPAGNSTPLYKQFPYKKGSSCSACRGSCENKLCRR